MIRKLLLPPCYNFASLGLGAAAMAMEALNSPTCRLAVPAHSRAEPTSAKQNSSATRKLERLFSMQGGKGETSYAQNSRGQAKHWRSLRPLLEDALQAFELPSGTETVTVADLGCSSGQNTLGVVGFIVDQLRKRYCGLSLTPPEFQAFFSDLPSNDFNTLFHLLPPTEDDSSSSDADIDCRQQQAPQGYYAAGVPGSFYRRLFPRNSINIFHSSFSLHWLSQVPDAVQDPTSEAWNKGRVFIHGGSEAPAAAYLAQFRRDFESFLRARAEESRPGGCMFLVCLGRTKAAPTDQGGGGILFGTHFESAWDDLVNEGLIEAERRDSFNLPLFAPTAEELLGVVETEGSFRADRVEIFKGGSPLVVDSPSDPVELGRAFTNTCRTVCGVLVDDHIGSDLGAQLFLRVQAHATRHAPSLLHDLQFYHVVASLTRK